jgi:hypothetical protein
LSELRHFAIDSITMEREQLQDLPAEGKIIRQIDLALNYIKTPRAGDANDKSWRKTTGDFLFYHLSHLKSQSYPARIVNKICNDLRSRGEEKGKHGPFWMTTRDAVRARTLFYTHLVNHPVSDLQHQSRA